MASPAGKTPMYQVHAPALSPESWGKVQALAQPPCHACKHSSQGLCYLFPPSAWEPQPRKAVGAGDGGKTEKSQEHENGESWKTCKNSAQKSGLLLGGDRKEPQASGSHWPRATEKGPMVQPPVYKDVCRTFRNVCLQHGRHDQPPR